MNIKQQITYFEPINRFTFWRETNGNRLFLLIDDFINSENFHLSFVWLLEIKNGKAAQKIKVPYTTFLQQIEKELLQECSIKIK